jgi:hypothetical protein
MLGSIEPTGVAYVVGAYQSRSPLMSQIWVCLLIASRPEPAIAVVGRIRVRRGGGGRPPVAGSRSACATADELTYEQRKSERWILPRTERGERMRGIPPPCATGHLCCSTGESRLRVGGRGPPPPLLHPPWWREVALVERIRTPRWIWPPQPRHRRERGSCTAVVGGGRRPPPSNSRHVRVGERGGWSE